MSFRTFLQLLIVVAMLHTRSDTVIGLAQEGDAPPTASAGKTGKTSQTPRKRFALTAQQRKVADSARRRTGRAFAIKDAEQRRNMLSQVLKITSRQIQENSKSPALVIELLGGRAKAEVELAELVMATSTVARMHALYRGHYGVEEFGKWLPDTVDRLRNTRYFQLAILHLSESLKELPNSETAAGQSLLVADILANIAYPNGPYDKAIEQYEKVFQRYKSQFIDVASEARLRQGRMLWWNGEIDEAMRVFTELSKIAPEPIAEMARHFPQILKGEPGIDPAPIP